MKKAIIALAVAAGSIAAAQADTTTLYGEIGYATPIDFGNVSNDKVKVADRISAGLNNSALTNTKIGVKGEEDLGNGISAIFKYEFGIAELSSQIFYANSDELLLSRIRDGIDHTRKAFVGFKGDFGQLTLGVQDSVWGDFTGKANYFNADGVFGGYFDEGYGYASGVRYDAPEMNGVKAALSYDFRGKTAEVGVGYNLEGIDLGAALQYNVGGYIDSMGNRSLADQSHYRVGVSAEYAADAFKVAADYQFHPEFRKDADDAEHYIGLGASYNVTDDSALYGVMQFNAKEFSDDGQRYGLGYQYDLSERTRAWVEAGLFHRGETPKGADNTINHFQMSVGVRHKF